ncbi:MAG: hypothetical protein FJ291_06340 [Planctomycetes bacterium]|nr:hypothetical protein [Planctomycetota bacterium]
MLAEPRISAQAGRLNREVHLPWTARYELVDFIAEELPRWRDDPQRSPVVCERVLTDQLCGHLNGAARLSEGWSWVQFRTEVPDEVRSGRAVDLTAKPCGVAIIIEGRRHTQFDTLLPIECKRLPTPEEPGRDEREYVVTGCGTTGGIQRFKLGLHGAAHRVAAMIAYVQELGFAHWLAQVNGWITALSAEKGSVWSGSDLLALLKEDSGKGLCTLQSRHHRRGGYDDCDLRHLWVRMN